MTLWDGPEVTETSKEIFLSDYPTTGVIKAALVGLCPYCNHCKRSIEYNTGCRLCWAVAISNSRKRVVESVTLSSIHRPRLVEIIDKQWLDIIGDLNNSNSISELFRIGLRLKRVVNTVERIVAGLNNLVSLSDSEAVVSGTCLPIISCLLTRELELGLKFQKIDHVCPIISRVFTDNVEKYYRNYEEVRQLCPELLIEDRSPIEDTNVFLAYEEVHEPLEQASKILDSILVNARLTVREHVQRKRYNPILALVKPDKVLNEVETAHATPRQVTPELIPDIDCDTYTGSNERILSDLVVVDTTRPAIYSVHVANKQLGTIVTRLGRASVDVSYSRTLRKSHEILLLHSSEIVENICRDAIDKYMNIESEDSLVDLISRCCSTVELRSTDAVDMRRSVNVYSLLENAKLYTADNDESIYSEAFKFLLTVEYAMHALGRCWSLLSMWQSDGKAVWTVWWSLRAHLTNIHQYLRIQAVETNQGWLMAKLEDAESRSDQRSLHAKFIERIEIDLFLTSECKPYKEAIIALCRLAVSFRTIIERCFAFQRDDEDVLFELENLIPEVKKITGFLRLNLKIWSFMS